MHYNNVESQIQREAGSSLSIRADGALSRSQFTFYDSFFKAVNGLPKSRQPETYRTIAVFALCGTEPVLTGSAESVFNVIRPVLESGRAKAEARIRKQVAGDS